MKLLALLFLFCTFTATANNTDDFQGVTVTGTVTGDGGAPLSGVSVQEKGTSTGATTDNNGLFTITVSNANATLVFSSVGYNVLERALNGQTSLTISLQSSTQEMDKVVVVGYGTQKKRDLTGSITSVKGEDLARMPNTNPVSSLQGRVAGLTIVNSGRAGSSPTVRIRGVNSTSNTDPLYVVDGVFQTDIGYLNPGDIESMEILRDPSSIAIFGLQGGNGVIIVTTKRAARGQTRVSFQSSVGVQKVTDKIDVTDAEGFKKLYNAQLANTPGSTAFDYRNYTANTDWQEQIFRDAIINNNTLSISNSNDKTTTLFSLGYNVQEGVLKNDRYQKFIGRLNEEIKITDKIKVGGDITGFHWNQQDPSADLNNALWAAPIVPIQVDDKTYYSMPSFQRAQVGNPVARINLNDGNAVDKGYRAVANIFGEIKFAQYFTFRSSFYSDLRFNTRRSYTPLPFRVVNLGEGTAVTDTFFNRDARTSVGQSQAESRRFQQDHTITFTKTINDKHSLTALAGFTTVYLNNSNVSGSRTDTILNIPDDRDYWYLNIVNANNPLLNSGGGGVESYMSYLARVNYSFENKYLLNLSFRRDGSSKFAPANRWGNFGSIGAGWVVSEEKFFQDVKHINFLKLRGAWGTVGSGLGLPANLYRPGLSNANTGVFGDRVYPGVTPAYIPDPNLHWEVVRGIDVGVDVRALKNRLTAELTWYDRTTKDIITDLTLPGTAGNYTYKTNLGTISNKGIEVSAGWRDHLGELTYAVSANYSYNKNKVESIGDGINFEILRNGGVNKTTTGQSIGYFFGYEQTGIYQTTAEVDKSPSMNNSRPGDIAYADVNKDGIIDAKDRKYLGTPFPVHNFGASINLGYKNLDLIVEGQGVAGNKIYTQRRTATFATVNYESNRLNAWTTAGSTNVEPILDNNRGNNFLFSTYFLEPGDYFRIRTVQLGYTFSRNLLQKTPVKQLRVYVSGQNLATFSRVTGYTPEAPLGDPISSGADNGLYPTPAVYSFGVNITF